MIQCVTYENFSENKTCLNERMNGNRSDWTKRRFQRSPVAKHFHFQNYDFNSHISLCCTDAQWSDDIRKACESYLIRRLNTIQPHASTRATRTKNGCVNACGRLTSGRLHTISEGWAGSSENTIKLYTIDGVTQVG